MKQSDEIKILLEALRYFYPGYFGDEPHSSKSYFEYKNQKYPKDWVLSETFNISKVPEKTSDIGVAIRELEKIFGSSLVEAPKPAAEANIPSAGLREAQKLHLEQLETQSVERKERIHRKTDAEIEARVKVAKDKEVLRKFQKAAEGEVVYAKVREPEEVKLAPAKEAVISNSQAAAVEDSDGLKVQVADEIKTRLKEVGVPGATDQEISDAADMTAENIVGVWSGASPIIGGMATKEAARVKVFTALANDPLTKRVVVNYADKQIAGFMMSKRIAGEVFGQEFAEKVFKVPESVQVSSTPVEGSTPLTVSKLLNVESSVPVSVQNINTSTPIGTVIRQPILARETAKPVFMTQAAIFKAKGYNFKSSVAAFKPVSVKPTFEPSRFSVSGAPLKTATSGIANFFADLASKGKIAVKGLETKQGVLIAGGAVLGIAGLASGNMAMATGGFSGAGIGFAINPGRAFTGAAFGNMIAPVIGLVHDLLGGILVAIILPIAITIICVPLVIALILFIINSGAYIVPPSPASSADNPYMLVTKTASPSKVGNPNPKQTITYTVTITALKEPLSFPHIVSQKCNVVKKNGASLGCPTENIPAPPSDLIIPLTTPYSFTFSVDFGSQYSDSAVYDSIEIGATSTTQKSITTSGSASVCIGDCPADCVNVNDKSWSGNTNGQANLQSAINTLSGQYHNYVVKVCKAGAVNLCYTTSSPSPMGVGGECNQATYAKHVHGGQAACDINFNKCGTGSSGDALYLLTHELTHHIQMIDTSWESRYDASAAWHEVVGGGLCSYYNTHNPNYTMEDRRSESMAEGDALYVGSPSWVSCLTSSYQRQYPQSYLFAKDVMFGP